jgi:hypothetical protein
MESFRVHKQLGPSCQRANVLQCMYLLYYVRRVALDSPRCMYQ